MVPRCCCRCRSAPPRSRSQHSADHRSAAWTLRAGGCFSCRHLPATTSLVATAGDDSVVFAPTSRRHITIFDEDRLSTRGFGLSPAVDEPHVASPLHIPVIERKPS